MTDILTLSQELTSKKKSYVVVTMVNAIGSAPQEVGAKMIVVNEGLFWGTVGGGKVENAAITKAKEMLTTRQKYFFANWNLQKDIGMTCGGVVSFYFESHTFENKFNVAIFGAGHVAQELTKLLLNLDINITCIDHREEWLNKLPNSIKLHKVNSNPMSDYVQNLSEDTFIAIMTMGHATDLPILVEVLKRKQKTNCFPYIGNIGSEQKAKRLYSDLKNQDFSQELIESVRCPIGESFGNNTPFEIALSIISQIIKTRDQLKILS